MGIKIVLTESQAERLQAKVGRLQLTEAKMSCTDLYYSSLSRFIGDKSSKILGNNTVVRRIDADTVAIKYHNTDILTISQDDTIKINTNGYETVTTKDRLNQFLRCKGFYIFQKKGVWYISDRKDTAAYFDGMRISSSGNLITADTRAIKNNILDLIKNKEIDPKFSDLYGVNNDF